MKQETKGNYASSMVVFYMVARYAWKLYLKYWESFAGMSDQYTQEFGNTALKAIDAAQAMPDVTQRRAGITQQGNELDASSIEALLFWKKLRRFIMKAFPVAADSAAAIIQAGGAHFAQASKGVLTEITQLLIAGQTYLAANSELLLAKGKMPAAFAADYGKAKDAFDEEHLEYGDAKSEATDGTTDRVTANNTLNTGMQEMFGDAQLVFEKQKTIAKQFSYAAVKRLVTKDMAGIHFSVVNAATGKPVTNAVITTDESKEAQPVNNRGVLNFIMKVGVHSVTVTSPDFAPYSGVVKVDAGVMHRVKIVLAKADVAVAVES